MRKNKGLVFVFCLALLFYGMLSGRERDRSGRKNDGLTLPVRFLKNGAPTIPVRLNGRWFWAQIDTGFNGTIFIPNSIISSLKLMPLKKLSVQQMWKGAARSRQSFLLASFSLGHDLVASNLTVISGPSRKTILIGLKILSHFNVLFDFPESRVIFFSTDVKPPRFEAVSFSLTPFLTLSAFEKDLGHIKLVLDSGMIILDKYNGYDYPVLSMNSPKVRKLLAHQKNLPQWKGTPSDASVKKALYFYAEALYIDRLNFGETVFLGAPLDPSFHDGALGLGFFKHRRIFIDFKNKLLFLSPVKVALPRF